MSYKVQAYLSFYWSMQVEVEAARTAAMNQEIKRVLTEVLLKVIDDKYVISFFTWFLQIY